MFNEFTSSDKRERERKTFRRLCSLRIAYRAGYFNETPVEPFEPPLSPTMQFFERGAERLLDALDDTPGHGDYGAARRAARELGVDVLRCPSCNSDEFMRVWRDRYAECGNCGLRWHV